MHTLLHAASTKVAGLLQLRKIRGLIRSFRYRISVGYGDIKSIYYEVGRVGDDKVIVSYDTPRVIWLKDGKPSSKLMINNVRISNSGIRSTVSVNFTNVSDQGVYSCIFIDTVAQGSELLFPTPGKLAASECLDIEAIC